MIYLLIILILIIIISYIFCIVWVKIRNPFWSKQPVFNYYNIYTWLFPCGIINNSLPEKTKYYNVRNIVFKNVNQLSENEKSDIIYLIQHCYYKTSTIHYFPRKCNLFPYLTNNNGNTYISLYYKKKNIVGILTGRPLEVNLNNNNFLTYYADYLCLDNNYRKNNISPELIYTHYYNQSHKEPTIITSLFKREHVLNSFVPLVEFNTYTFDINTWLTHSLHSSIKIIKITKENINLLHEYIKQSKKYFKCFITTSIGNLLELINTSNVLIYCTIINDIIYSAYFLRDLCTRYSKKKSIECFASIKTCSNELFLHSFSNVIYYLKQNYSILLMEEISDNYVIVNNILLKYRYMSKIKAAFYFYNFAIRPVKSESFCCIY